MEKFTVNKTLLSVNKEENAAEMSAPAGLRIPLVNICGLLVIAEDR